MLRKLISAIMAIACLFMLVAGAFGIRDIMKEKSDGEKEKAATLEKLDTLKAGKEKLEENRAAYEEGKTTYADGTAAYEQGKADYAALVQLVEMETIIIITKHQEVMVDLVAIQRVF